MKVLRNLLLIMLLITIVWITLLFISYIISVTVFYTLEHLPSAILPSILRVVIGLIIAGAWIIGWYQLTKAWLYKILLSRKEET